MASGGMAQGGMASGGMASGGMASGGMASGGMALRRHGQRHGFAFHRRSPLTVALERMWSVAIGRHVRMNTTLLRGGRGPAVGLYVSLRNGTRASRG